jgi:hypothetical protein
LTSKSHATRSYIFAKIGATSRRAVEICSGDGYENNVANLALLHGWEVIMMDGRENNMAHARRFYTQPGPLNAQYSKPQICNTSFVAGMPPTMKTPHLIRDFITRANVNQLISSKGFSGEIDLFSLDMDGVDWCACAGFSRANLPLCVTRAGQVDLARARRREAAGCYR